ncbi:MAG: InlB B-repeat-containing protein, partial [Spirochaetales bacterium]|nr:InlB B-repeat-containing protein [Spirochaetales bacterium]
WQKNVTYAKVTFNSNGGTGNMAEQSFTVGVSQKLSVNTFTRSGYTFVGWNSSADGSGRSYSNEQTLTFSDETSLTLYAQWQKNVTYAKVTFNSNGGTGSMSNQIFTAGVSQNLQANTFARADYTFIGWNTRADGSGTSYADKQSLTLTEAVPLTLYALWQKNVTYAKVTFNSNGGTGNMAEQSFTVGVSQKLSANIFTRSGYTFVGWNSSADGSGTNYSNEQTLTFSDETPLTLYAQWQKNIAKTEVSFASNGGSGNMPVQIFTEGESQNLFANTFIRNGYNFTGWNTKTDGSGTNYTDKQSLTLSGETTSLTLYAQWQKNVTYAKVTFNSNGGTGNMAEQSFTVGVSQNLQANIFTRADYTFIGWNSSADGSGTNYSNEQTLTFSEETSLTLYAQWQKTEVASYFLVPNLDTLNLYKDSNTIVKEDLLGESVTLEECFGQVADEDGNLYFSYKNEDEVIIAKYANANVSEIIRKDGYIYNVRLSYYDSKLYVSLDNIINVVENGELKEIYEATEIINAFIVDNGYIYFAVQNFNENNNEIYKITVAGGNEVLYKSINCGEHNSFISDMTVINGNLYLLQLECAADFPNLYYPEYWRGSLVRVRSSQQEKFALSSSDFGTETSFYSPLRFLAVRKNELLIMDDGFVVEDWEVIQKNRVATFDLEEEQIDFSDMTEGMLYKFTGSL